jgi:hypothetical protein
MKLWKTPKKYYIHRFMFTGMGKDEDGDTMQVSISCPFYIPFSDIPCHVNIKRYVMYEWKAPRGWKHHD